MSEPRFAAAYWVPVSPDGCVLHFLIHQLKKDAIRHAVSHENWTRQSCKSPLNDRRDWNTIRREGWRIIKVKITPAENDG